MSQALLTLFNFVSTLLTHTLYMFFFLGVCLKVRHKAAAGERERQPTQYAYKRERERAIEWGEITTTAWKTAQRCHISPKSKQHIYICVWESLSVLSDLEIAITLWVPLRHQSTHCTLREGEQVESVYRERERERGERDCQRAQKRERTQES